MAPSGYRRAAAPSIYAAASVVSLPVPAVLRRGWREGMVYAYPRPAFLRGQRVTRRSERTLPVDTGVLTLQRDADAANAWFVDLDGRRQSHVDLEEPARLLLAYVRRMGHVLDLLPPAGDPLDAVHLGAGGLTLPRYIAATRPGSRQRVFEVDAALAEAVREALPLHPRWRIRVRICDALDGLRALRDDSADVVIGDAFRDGLIPEHLVVADALTEIGRVLRPSGTYLVNVLDPLVARRTIAALREEFRTVVAVLDAARRASGGNVVVVATNADLALPELRSRLAADPRPGRLAT